MYLSKCPAAVLEKQYNKKFKTCSFLNSSSYAYMEIDSQGRMKFNIKMHDHKKALVILVSKAHLFEMLLQHLTFRPIYPYYDQQDRGFDHIWTYDQKYQKLSDGSGLKQFPDIDKMTPIEIGDYHRDAVQHLAKYIPQVSGVQKARAERQMQKLLDRQWKIDILYEAEKAKRIFKLEDAIE